MQNYIVAQPLNHLNQAHAVISKSEHKSFTPTLPSRLLSISRHQVHDHAPSQTSTQMIHNGGRLDSSKHNDTSKIFISQVFHLCFLAFLLLLSGSMHIHENRQRENGATIATVLFEILHFCYFCI